jgi:NAD-dependent SIR2 family protein deacetylase
LTCLTRTPFRYGDIVDASFDVLTQILQNAAKSAAHASLMAEISKAAAQAQPTTFHKLLKAFLDKGILGRVYTQNIDNLEIKAGLTTTGEDPDCIQLHGSVMMVQCIQCSFTEHVYHHFPVLSAGELPICPRCKAWIESRKLEGKRTASKGGLLRPSIILYGESHPNDEHIAAMQALDGSQADSLLVVGTSLKTSGSVRLIKDISIAVRKRVCGGVYYLDVEEPPASQVKMFDQVLRADCQDFANHMFNLLGTPEHIRSADYLQTKGDLAHWVEAGRIREDMRPSWDWV